MRLLLSLTAMPQHPPLRNAKPKTVTPAVAPLAVPPQKPKSAHRSICVCDAGCRVIPSYLLIFSNVFLSYVDLRVALIFSFPLLICLLCTILPLTVPAGSLCYVIITDARFHRSRSICVRDVGCPVITSYLLIIIFLFQRLSILHGSSCCSHLSFPLLICLLCTILPSTLLAHVCMYV